MLGVGEAFHSDRKFPKRELPSVRSIKHYQQKEAILAIIERETVKDLETLKNEKGDLRRLAMNLLNRHGGMKGAAIGELLGIDYSAVSQERKRLRERVGILKSRIVIGTNEKPTNLFGGLLVLLTL